MSNNAFEHYLEAEVLSADPVKLVSLLHRGALEATGAARRHLAKGAILDRSRQINRAWQMVQELAASLDHAQGGKLSAELAELYHYMQVRLLEANAGQTDGPLAEVEALLTTLAEAWREIQPKASAAPPPADYVPVACNA